MISSASLRSAVKFILGISVAFTINSVAIAESLHDALRWAAQDNEQLIAMRAQVDAVRAGIGQAQSARLPNINVQGNYNDSEISVENIGEISSSEQVSATISGSILLFDGGQARNNVSSARAQLEAVKANLKSLEQQILLGTVQSYLDVLRDQRLLNLANNNMKLMDTRLRSARISFDVGAITRGELSSAEALEASARAQLSAAEVALERSRQSYKIYTKRSPGNLENVTKMPALPNNLAEVLDIALRDSISVKAAIEAERAAMHLYRAAQNNRYPKGVLNTSLTRSRDYSGGDYTDNRNVGVSVSIPIYLGGALSSQQVQARANFEKAMADTNYARALAEQSVNVSWSQFQNAKAIYQANLKASKARKIANDGSEIQFEEGSITLVQRLDDEQTYLEAKSNATTSLYNQYLAGFQLLAAMGHLTSEKLGLFSATKNTVNSPDSLVEAKAASHSDKISSRWSD